MDGTFQTPGCFKCLNCLKCRGWDTPDLYTSDTWGFEVSEVLWVGHTLDTSDTWVFEVFEVSRMGSFGHFRHLVV